MGENFLKPKTTAPPFIRSQKHGQFINPPPYMDNWGGFTSSAKLMRTKLHNMMNLEKGGPQTRRGKPI